MFMRRPSGGSVTICRARHRRGRCEHSFMDGARLERALEDAERGPQEGVLAAGGNALARIRFGVLPQVLPVMAGQVLYLFESNIRASAIIGIVGAGGIGLQLAEMIRTLEWPVVSAIVCMILVVVAVIDFCSGRLRAAMAA